MIYILNIETATSNCSVSLSNENTVINCIELNEGFTHAENLHVFIEELLRKSNITINQLKAVVVSAGPGSYTGLRIGVSTAKGICYALNIPLIAINTLQILSAAATQNLSSTNTLLCPMLDARRMEVYCALYDLALNECSKTEAKIINEETIQSFKNYSAICFFGDGMPKCKNILSELPNVSFIEDIVPSASNMAKLGYKKYINKQFEDIAYFEPYYLKDFLVTKKVIL